jgi:hypothetical protein
VEVAAETNATFVTTFTYELTKDEAPFPQNPRIEMELPTLVKVIARPTMPSCNDCEPGAVIVGKPIKH